MVLSKEVDSSQLGIRQDQLKLHYQKIQDFTIISNTPIEKLTPQQLESKASCIPEMENISLDKFNTTMTEIKRRIPLANASMAKNHLNSWNNNIHNRGNDRMLCV